MEKSRVVISWDNLPTRLPIWRTVIVFMLLRYEHASDLVCGIVYTLLALWWAASICAVLVEKHQDLNGFGKIDK